ncbi:hypothetical protein ACFPPF_09395 [Xenophilus aerolatus]|nr:hypothetical protein [Xenophilus aerolatus]
MPSTSSSSDLPRRPTSAAAPARPLPARSTDGPSSADSRDVPRLRPLQRAALNALSDGSRIAMGGLRGVDAAHAQRVVAFPTPTVQALLRWGFIEEEERARGVYRVTDHGRRALAVLPAC